MPQDSPIGPWGNSRLSVGLFDLIAQGVWREKDPSQSALVLFTWKRKEEEKSKFSNEIDRIAGVIGARFEQIPRDLTKYGPH